MTEDKRSKIIPFLGYVIPILLVVYVLSIGPVLALLYDSDRTLTYPEYVSLFDSFYAPVISVSKSNDSLGNLRDQYINFWVRRF